MSGIRVSEFKKPKTIIVDQAKVESSYGPKSMILLESLASAYSKSGFTIEVKGLSRDSLMNGLFVTIPLQVRWRTVHGQRILPNTYRLASNNTAFGVPDAQNDPVTNAMTDCMYALNNNFFMTDNLCIRPSAFKCIRNATLSINGSSFSTRTDAYYTALSKLFCDGRVEAITGAAYESFPYNNSGEPRLVDQAQGWRQRCLSLNDMGKVVHTEFGGAQNLLTDIVFQYDIKFPLWFGPFTHEGFPGLTGFDGQTISSIPYVSDLVLEATFTDDPLSDMFACSDNFRYSGVAQGQPAQNKAPCVSAVTDLSPDTYTMWQNCLVGDIKSDPSKFVGLLQPKLCYVFSEPDPDKMQLSPIYTLPSYRLITYEDRKQLTASGFASDQNTVLIQFPYIRLSNISALYCCMAEYDRVDNGTCIAARSARQDSGNWNGYRLGAAAANRTCPIRWDTVKVSMSTSSSVLANFVRNTITPQRQYELFKKYSSNAMQLTYEEWKESSQMLLFSAEELCGIGAFANSFQALTMSISFEVERTCVDTKLRTADYTISHGNAAQNAGDNVQAPAYSHIGIRKGNNVPRAVVGRLICLEPELVSISEGAVSVEQVKLSQQELHNQLLGGAPEIEDANKLDELAR